MVSLCLGDKDSVLNAHILHGCPVVIMLCHWESEDFSHSLLRYPKWKLARMNRVSKHSGQTHVFLHCVFQKIIFQCPSFHVVSGSMQWHYGETFSVQVLPHYLSMPSTICPKASQLVPHTKGVLWTPDHCTRRAEQKGLSVEDAGCQLSGQYSTQVCLKSIF